MRRAVIREADVVLTTLSGSGADVYSACMETFVPVKKFGGRKDVPEDDFFSAVVIDEAGQVVSRPLLGFTAVLSVYVCYKLSLTRFIGFGLVVVFHLVL